jgi:acyl-CoA synthetase (AMP-forming)/AMP-acid ligase II
MAGYHNNAKANAECMLEDGWLDSGDLGFVHQGELVLTGRAKEMIILRGANYYCYEVEGVVAALPGVRTTRVAATSVRDESEGTEQMLVFFVPAGEAAADAADVQLLHDHGVLLDPLKLLVVAARAQLGAALGAPSPLSILHPRVRGGLVVCAHARAHAFSCACACAHCIHAA